MPNPNAGPRGSRPGIGLDAGWRRKQAILLKKRRLTADEGDGLQWQCNSNSSSQWLLGTDLDEDMAFTVRYYLGGAANV